MDEKFLNPVNQKAAAAFINSQLWIDIRRALIARRPEAADVKDESHIAAAKGHKRAAWDELISTFEKMPFEVDEAVQDPFARPAVMHTAD